jgi:hypothetical protein
MWQEVVEARFTKQPISDTIAGGMGNFEKFQEEKVDAMR